jgi:hypothetical protein
MKVLQISKMRLEVDGRPQHVAIALAYGACRRRETTKRGG